MEGSRANVAVSHLSSARRSPLVAVFTAAAAGAYLDRLEIISPEVWWVLAGAAGGGWLVVARRGGRVETVGAALLLSVVAAAAGLWHDRQWRRFDPDDLGWIAGVQPVPVCVEVIARSNPVSQRRIQSDLDTWPANERTRLLIEATQVRDGTRWRRGAGLALLVVQGRLSGVRVGDQLRVGGQLSAPAGPGNPGEFDFSRSERIERRLFRLEAESPACVQLVRRGSRWTLGYWLEWIRDRGREQLDRYLAPDRAGLAAAVLLGTRDQIDPQSTLDFMRTGTVHLLSISGLHVGILAYAILLCGRLGWVARPRTLLTAIVFVALYALLTDARPPVVRAAWLVAVMCTARYWGRQPWSGNSLAGAGIVVFLCNPASLFQVGTQLSFLAVATMVAWPSPPANVPASDPLERLLADTAAWPVRWVRRLKGEIGLALGLSWRIWWTSWPLVWREFHLLSPIAIVLNPLVCLPMSVAMFAGVGVMLWGPVWPAAAAVCAWLCDRSFWMMEQLIAAALLVPGNHGWLPAPPDWWVVSFYAVLLGSWLCPKSVFVFLQHSFRVQLARCWPIVARRCRGRGWRALVLLSDHLSRSSSPRRAQTVSEKVGTILPGPRWRKFAIGGLWILSGLGLALLPTAWSQRIPAGEFRCSFIAVGHGTSVLLELPDGETWLYDAGHLGSAAGGVGVISGALWSRGYWHIDRVFISHADADHYNAIPGLLERFSVGAIYAPPGLFARRTPPLNALRAALERHQVSFHEMTRGTHWKLPRGSSLRALHPPPGSIAGSDNARSLVLQVESAGRRLLLPGDLEAPGLDLLLSSPPLDCDWVMAPHHGSTRSNPRGFAAWTTPEVVVISGGGGKDWSPVAKEYRAAGAWVGHTANSGMITCVSRAGASRVTEFLDPPRKLLAPAASPWSSER